MDIMIQDNRRYGKVFLFFVRSKHGYWISTPDAEIERAEALRRLRIIEDECAGRRVHTLAFWIRLDEDDQPEQDSIQVARINRLLDLNADEYREQERAIDARLGVPHFTKG